MEAKRAEKMTGRERQKVIEIVFLGREGCCDLAGGGETDIISSDCSTSPLPSIQHTNCFLSQSVHGHAHKTPSQTEQHITRTSQPEEPRWHFPTSKLRSTVFICFLSVIFVLTSAKQRKIAEVFFPHWHILMHIILPHPSTSEKKHSLLPLFSVNLDCFFWLFVCLVTHAS